MWYNKSYKDLYHHVHDNDGILGKELRLLVPYEKPLNRQSPNDVWYVRSSYESQDSPNDCLACCRLCDGLVRSLTTCARDAFPSLSDVLGYIQRFLLEHKHIQRNQYNGHLSTSMLCAVSWGYWLRVIVWHTAITHVTTIKGFQRILLYQIIHSVSSLAISLLTLGLKKHFPF